MSIVLDLIVLGIIAFYIFISAKRGFVKVLVETVGFIAAIVIAFTISTPLATATYDKIIEPPVIKAATEVVGEGVESTALNALPEFIVNNEKLSATTESFTRKITENMAQGAEAAVKTASQDIIKPIAAKIIGLLYALILVIILLIVVKFAAKLLNKMFSFSFVGTLNRTLGGVIGAFKGGIIALVFCMVVSLIISFTGKGLWIFTAENIGGSYIFKFLTEILH